MRALYQRKLQLTTELGNLQGLPPLSAALVGAEHPALRRMPKTGAFVHLNEVTPHLLCAHMLTMPTMHVTHVMHVMHTVLAMLTTLTIHPPPQQGHVAAGADPALPRRHRHRVCRRRPERAVVRVARGVARGGAHRGREDIQAARPPALPRRVRRHPRGRAEHPPGRGGGAGRAPADAVTTLLRVGQRGLQQHKPQSKHEWKPARQAPAGHDTLEHPAQLGRGRGPSARLPAKEFNGAVGSATSRGSLRP